MGIMFKLIRTFRRASSIKIEPNFKNDLWNNYKEKIDLFFY